MGKSIEEQVEIIQRIMGTKKKKRLTPKKKKVNPADNIDISALPESLKHLVKGQ